VQTCTIHDKLSCTRLQNYTIGASVSVSVPWNLSLTNRACLAYPATSPSSLLRAYLIGRPAVCCGVVLPVCPCVGVVFQSPRARHAQLVTDILARMSRGCYEENCSFIYSSFIEQSGCVAQWQNVGLWPVNFLCPALDLQLMGDHYCG